MPHGHEVAREQRGIGSRERVASLLEWFAKTGDAPVALRGEGVAGGGTGDQGTLDAEASGGAARAGGGAGRASYAVATSRALGSPRTRAPYPAGPSV